MKRSHSPGETNPVKKKVGSKDEGKSSGESDQVPNIKDLGRLGALPIWDKELHWHRSVNTACFEYPYEINLFIHVHLRHYDEQGQGRKLDATFIDRYGAPIKYEESWMEGYKAIEKAVLEHNQQCVNENTYFPKIAGFSGGTHLYKLYNEKNPWNWTGWIPLHKTQPFNDPLDSNSDLQEEIQYSNRFFISLRGNEIQNDMWDYDPGSLLTDEAVKGPYQGGYWYQGNVEARYLHVMMLKTNLPKDERRYNYIVHPLAYRPLMDELPNNGVDGIQWSVNNINKEKHLKMREWGGKMHGFELFNEYTYFHTWINDGVVKNADVVDGYIVWYDTYPLEYCEFILDNALSHGVYLHALSANDAFYDRFSSTLNSDAPDGDDHDMEPAERMLIQRQILLSDPKGKHLSLQSKDDAVDGSVDLSKPESTKYKRWEERDVGKLGATLDAESAAKLKASNDFLAKRPYDIYTVFGYTALLDTERKLQDSMFQTEMRQVLELNEGEDIIMDMLQKGQFYSHTGIYDVFDYEDSDHLRPIPVNVLEKWQKNPKEMWYNDKMKDFDLIFQFPPEKKSATYKTVPPWKGKLIWRYTIEYTQLKPDTRNPKKKKKELVLSTGYFKLSDHKATELDLQHYKAFKVRWIRFTIFHADNPMKRAWFSPIRGKHFNDFQDDYNSLSNRIAVTAIDAAKTTDDLIAIKDNGKEFKPTSIPCGNTDALEYLLEKSPDEKGDLHCYFLQANSVLPKSQKETWFGPVDWRAPRYLQNVHGYFPVSANHSTKLILSNSWDSSTVKDNKVFFYKVDGDTCGLELLVPHVPK